MGPNDNRLTPTETAIEQRDNGTTKNTNHPGTAATETKRRGRPPGTTKTREETKLPGLATVNQPKAVEIDIPGTDQEEKPKKKAGRPKKAAAAPAPKVDSTQIQLLLVTISGLVASRPGMEVWNLSADEARQIADPLSNIMAKNEALGNAIGEHADAFALVAACFMVFLPKFILYMATKPKKPKEGKKLDYGTGQPTKPQEQERAVRGINEPNVRANTRPAKNANSHIGGQLSQLIPPVGGF